MDLPDRKFTTDDWSHMLHEMCQHWSKWDPPESVTDAFWSVLSQHTAHAVRMAHRDIVARYSANGTPQLPWYVAALKDHRPEITDDGWETVQVGVPVARSTMIAELERHDRERMQLHAVGHRVQRRHLWQAHPLLSEDPEHWSDELLWRTWESCRRARGVETESRAERRRRATQDDGPSLSAKEWREQDPIAAAGRLMAVIGHARRED